MQKLLIIIICQNNLITYWHLPSIKKNFETYKLSGLNEIFPAYYFMCRIWNFFLENGGRHKTYHVKSRILHKKCALKISVEELVCRRKRVIRSVILWQMVDPRDILFLYHMRTTSLKANPFPRNENQIDLTINYTKTKSKM